MIQSLLNPSRLAARDNSLRQCPNQRILLLTLILLVAAVPRIFSLYLQLVHHDEVWSIYQSIGTPQQILTWLPYDWPPPLL